LTNQLDIHRPVCTEVATGVRIAQGGDVVGQGVKPDVDHMPLVARHRNTPGKGGTGYREVPQPLLQKRNDLVPLGAGLDKVGVGFNVGQQAFAIGAHFEKIGLFLQFLHRPVAVRALAVLSLGLGPEGLTGGAVPVLILTQIDIALIHQLLEDVADTLLVALLSGADEVTVGDTQLFPQGLKSLDHAVGQFKRRFTGRLGCLFEPSVHARRCRSEKRHHTL